LHVQTELDIHTFFIEYRYHITTHLTKHGRPIQNVAINTK